MLEYIASGNIPVRVGQSAKENDQLTNTSDPGHWWMHASGYPGAPTSLYVTRENELPKDVKIGCCCISDTSQ
jgi:predicted ribosome quality control (RQC) complex YloA/Tae2 family protein